jgi:sirohydrochlorin ferrochelatase
MRTAHVRRTPAAQAFARAMKSAQERGHFSWHYVAGFLSSEHPSLSKEIEAFERARIDALLSAAGSAS